MQVGRPEDMTVICAFSMLMRQRLKMVLGFRPARCSYWLRGRQRVAFLSSVLRVFNGSEHRPLRRAKSMCCDEASRRTRDRHFTPSSRFDLVRRCARWRLISADTNVWNAPPPYQISNN